MFPQEYSLCYWTVSCNWRQIWTRYSMNRLNVQLKQAGVFFFSPRPIGTRVVSSRVSDCLARQVKRSMWREVFCQVTKQRWFCQKKERKKKNPTKISPQDMFPVKSPPCYPRLPTELFSCSNLFYEDVFMRLTGVRLLTIVSINGVFFFPRCKLKKQSTSKLLLKVMSHDTEHYMNWAECWKWNSSPAH